MRAIIGIALIAIVFGQAYSVNVTRVPKEINGKKVYAHLMPWFETRETSDEKTWGIHWTMSTMNPDVIIDPATNKRQIAAHYYPDIHPYGSGTEGLIDYQIQMMKYAGLDGVLIDWPGTTNAWDYPKNARNADNFIRKLEAAGLEFAIVYEDHNLGMAHDGGMIGDVLTQGRQDMTYLQNNYFNKPNYIKINGAPLLMTFGPQTLTSPSDWESLFSVLGQKPTFLTLWYQQEQAGASGSGEYPWIYSDFMEGLINFYNNRQAPVKFGVCYPGFNTFYNQGGWPGPDWGIPVSQDTFTRTLDAALNSDVKWIQVATWNDYGEGTIIEPTREFGNDFLNILQRKLKVNAGNEELETIKSLYQKRQQYKNNKTILSKLDAVNEALNSVNPSLAKKLLEAI